MVFLWRRPSRAHARWVWAGGLALGAAAALAQPAVHPVRAAQIAAGQAIAQARCAVCHGDQGQSVAPDFPRLAGQNASYMHKQLMDFAEGRRKSPVMLDKAQQLSSEQMYAVGLYYQSLKPAVTWVADVPMAQVGQFVYDRGNPHSALPACVTCHGTGARGTAELPRLAGQHPEYIIKQVKAFQSGQRANDHTIMHLIASRVSDMELQAVATYLGGLQ
jgi:cytochrome c553